MSNKPLKASDQKKLNAIMEKKIRKVETMMTFPPYMYIVSEGVKTEPNYIKGLVDKINAKYQKFLPGERIVVNGTGRNTKSLLDFARKMVDKEFPQAKSVWLLYDKDDFPYDDFDNTQYSAEQREDKREYKVAWSNECIELWFLLHFQELSANVGREQYYKMLTSHFKSIGYEKYEKNLENIYDIISDKTDIAISRAEKQYNEYEKTVPPSRRCPATRIFELIRILNNYL